MTVEKHTARLGKGGLGKLMAIAGPVVVSVLVGKRASRVDVDTLARSSDSSSEMGEDTSPNRHDVVKGNRKKKDVAHDIPHKGALSPLVLKSMEESIHDEPHESTSLPESSHDHTPPDVENRGIVPDPVVKTRDKVTTAMMFDVALS